MTAPGQPVLARTSEEPEAAKEAWPSRAGRLVLEVSRGATSDRVTGLAAEVAFFGLLSVFPALIAVAAAVGFLDHVVGGELASDAREEVLSILRTFLTDEADQSIEAVDSLFRDNSSNVLTLALLGSLVTASRGTAAVIRALDTIHDVEDRRSWVRQRLIALVLMVASVLVMALTLAVLVLGPLLGQGRSIAGRVGWESTFISVWGWLRSPVMFTVLVGWAAGVLRLAPDRSLSWRSVFPGALLTGVLWLAASAGLRAYLAVSGAVNQVFGVLGGALILVVWIYLLSLALLLGGELNAVLVASGRRSGPPRGWRGCSRRDGRLPAGRRGRRRPR